MLWRFSLLVVVSLISWFYSSIYRCNRNNYIVWWFIVRVRQLGWADFLPRSYNKRVLQITESSYLCLSLYGIAYKTVYKHLYKQCVAGWLWVKQSWKGLLKYPFNYKLHSSISRYSSIAFATVTVEMMGRNFDRF